VYPTLLDLFDHHLVVRAGETGVRLAVLVCLWLAPRWAEALAGVDRRQARRATIVLALIFLAGARLHFLANHWRVYATRPLEALVIWGGSFHLPGGVIALVLATPLVCRRYGLALGRFNDGGTPAVGVGIAIARLGCFLQSCCFGSVCHWPWCVSFPPDSLPQAIHARYGLVADGARSLPVHPLQLYFVGAALLVTGVSVWLYPRRRYDGQVALVGLLLYSASSAALEFWRADHPSRTYWGPLPQLAWTTLAMTVASLAGLGVGEIVHRRRRRAAASTRAAPHTDRAARTPPWPGSTGRPPRRDEIEGA
jgi:phosphatidylglycerol:prolipoprotein diacylglycerol transferase